MKAKMWQQSEEAKIATYFILSKYFGILPTGSYSEHIAIEMEKSPALDE